MGRAYKKLQGKNTAVLIIGDGEPEDAARLARMYKLPFPVLADPDRVIYEQYNLGKVLFMWQRTATVLVDMQSKVKYIHRATNPQDSLDLDELMNAVDTLQMSD